MNTTQPQLLDIALTPGDVIYTPDWTARDMVTWFKPTGRILEPCRGEDAIYRYLPGAEWCEIKKGRDFFAWTKEVDWIVGNPPYTSSIFRSWISHSFDLANDIVYLIPPYKIYTAQSQLEELYKWGGLKHMRWYGPGSRLGFPNSNPVAAVHFVRGYHGGMSASLCKPQLPAVHRRKAKS